jgi:hypothetical protein
MAISRFARSGIGGSESRSRSRIEICSIFWTTDLLGVPFLIESR